MSYLANQGEQSTSAEIEALANLAALATSPAGQFVRKTGATTFENAAASGVVSGVLAQLTATGTINDTNLTFTFTEQPFALIINGAWYFQTGGAITWSYSSGTVTLSSAVGTGGTITGISANITIS